MQIALYQSVLAENGIDASFLASLAEAGADEEDVEEEEEDEEDALSEASSMDADVEIVSSGSAVAGQLKAASQATHKVACLLHCCIVL